MSGVKMEWREAVDAGNMPRAERKAAHEARARYGEEERSAITVIWR